MAEGLERPREQTHSRVDGVSTPLVATFYFVRHAKAGSRSHWNGDDRRRPLSQKGIKQAEALIEVFAKFDISGIHSSPYLRCMQTVEPLAEARKLEVETETGLAEGHGLVLANEFFKDPNRDGAVLCTHGDIVWELVEDLTKRHVLPAFRDDFDKGSTWVVEVKAGVPVKAWYIPAP